MFRLSIIIFMLLLAKLTQAKTTNTSFYQVDLLVFTHQQDPTLAHEPMLSSSLSPKTSGTIRLQTEISRNPSAYHLLPSAKSQLQNAYWTLHRKAQYRILLHYSWLQPQNSQQAVAIPKIEREGWQLEGILRVHQANYYLVDTELQLTDLSLSSFVIKQKQRLKGGETYYFDHPRVGMLVRIHKVV